MMQKNSEKFRSYFEGTIAVWNQRMMGCSPPEHSATHRGSPGRTLSANDSWILLRWPIWSRWL